MRNIPGQRKPKTGTMAWGERSDGLLNRREKAKTIISLAYTQVCEIIDLFRSHSGQLRPTVFSTDELMPPSTSLSSDALALAQETHQTPLLLHSWRTYFFGAIFARQEKIDYDRDILFASAILHDIALTDGHEPALCRRCFALSGAERVRAHLHAKGHPARNCDKVADAISLHLNARVSRRTHGAEAHLLSRGAYCDLFGIGKHRLDRQMLKQMLIDYPRTGVTEALQFETAEHAKNTRADFLTALARGKAPKDPFHSL